MRFSDAELASWVGAYLWPFFRIAAVFSVAPVLGARFVPVRTRLGLAGLITALVVPLLPSAVAVEPLSLDGLLVTLRQIAIGLGMGFVMRVVFGALELGGQIIAMQMGLSFAAMIDPQNGIQVPLLSAFYNLVGTLLFLALNGHLVLLQVLADSFHTLPVADSGLLATGFWALAAWGSELFAGAVVIALPVIAALTVVNLAFGVMARAAPQLNLFAVGFPISLLLGLVILVLSLSSLVPQLARLLEAALLTAQHLVTAGQ